MDVYSLTDLPLFVALPLLLVASGFFSGSETAMFSLTTANRLRLTRRGGVIANALESMLEDLQLLLITLMFGNMTINVLYFVISSALLLKLDAAETPVLAAAGTLAPLLLIIIAGEVLPKMVANLAPVLWLRVLVLPLFVVHRSITPLRIVLRSLVIAPLGRLFAPSQRPPALSADELAALVELSERRGVIDQSEEQMLREVVNLSQLKVRDIMVPRVDMQAVDVEAPPAELFELIRRERVTKLPAYRGDLDHVVGVIYARQFLLARASGRAVDLASLVRAAHFVPEVQRVDQLLGEFRKRGVHMAIAVDEYGGTAGVVTIRDIVERLVGEVDVESEDPGDEVSEAQPIGPGRWRVSGQLAVRDWATLFRMGMIPAKATTVGGLVAAQLRRLPEPGDAVTLGNLTLTVESVHQGRVGSVVLSVPTEAGGASAAAAAGGEAEAAFATAARAAHDGEGKR